MTPALSLENITVTFNDHRLFDSFSLSVPEGTKAVIHGRSGAGKTTLLRMALGYTIPDSGDIHVSGIALNGTTVWDIRKRIAYVGQAVTLGGGTVKDFFDRVFSYRANMHAIPSTDEIKEIIDYFELPQDVMQQETHLLSGGEKQRTALSAAFLLKRPLFLLDEVTAGLDTALKEKTIDRILSRADSTVIAVSHDRDWIERSDVRVYDLGDCRWTQ